MMLRRRFNAIDSRPPFGDIEIDLHEASLTPDEIRRKRKRKLHRLAHEGTAIPEKEVLRRLHRDGTCTAGGVPTECVVDDSPQFAPVYTVMHAELPVLGHHHGLHQHGRYIVELDPLPVITSQQDEIAQHQRRNGPDEVHGVKKDQHIGQGKNGQHGERQPSPYPTQPPAHPLALTGRQLRVRACFRYDLQ